MTTTPHHLEVGGRVQNPFGDLGGASNHQPVIGADDAAQLVLGQPRVHVHFNAGGVLEHLHADVPQLVTDQYLKRLLHEGVSFHHGPKRPP
jgi:hypothetical protein